MSENSAKSKRIAKNTLMLYFRMLLMMGVTFYTSRVVLSALGVEDYGIYNVVGGLTSMISMISVALSNGISRFITVELGKGNKKKLNVIFSTSVIIQIVISIIVAILIETIGLWFLVNEMVIPADRLLAAKWVLQFSLVTLIINLISTPYSALIVAHERMSAFASISILEVIGRLCIAYFITISPIDRLIFYSILMTFVALIIRFTYSAYCRKHFEESNFKWVFNEKLLKEMFGFIGWTFIGTSSVVIRDQGGNMLLNILGGGPIVNAARGIATQVNNAIFNFSSNFLTAINPQIIKSYATGEKEYLMTLIFQGARLGFYLLLILSLPVITNTQYVLELWLNIVPEYSVIFVRLSLILGMCEVLSLPLGTATQATGNIRTYQIVVGVLQLLNLPISYVLLKMGHSPISIMIVAILISLCCLMARLYLLRRSISLSVRSYLRKVLINVCIVSCISAIAPYIASHYMSDNFINFIIKCFICVMSTFASIYFVGCTKGERLFVRAKLAGAVVKIKNIL